VLSTDVRIFILTVAVSIINIRPLGVDNIILYLLSLILILYRIQNSRCLNISESYYILHATEVFFQFRNESYVNHKLKHLIIIP